MVNQGDIWEKLHEMDNKLQEMDNKLDNIEGDTNVQSQVLKEDSKEKLQNLFKRKFGRSENRRIVWYYLTDKMTIEEIHQETGISKSYVGNLVSEMNELSLINKEEKENEVLYYRSETTEGIELEDHIEKYVDDL